MITEESINFFRKTPPFQFLDESLIRTIAGNLSLEFTPKNTLILTQDGPPGDALRVIKKGGVKVYLKNDEDIVIDFKGEGDSVGYLSLISGDRSRANVQAVEDTLCYLIPRDIILEIINKNPQFSQYFMKSFFKNYLDKTYQEMRNRNLLFKEGEKILYTTPVSDIISKTPVTAGSNVSIQEAAKTMSRHSISSLVITDPDGRPTGIVTDRDLRDKVVASGADAAAPVSSIMSSNLFSLRPDRTCFDAISSMIKRNIHHLLVIDHGKLQGVVTNHDFMLLQGTSPLSILKTIERQHDIGELKDIRARITRTISILIREGVKAVYILRIITELHDRLIKKIIELSIRDMEVQHCPFVFFVYGAEGRREETFKTVFRCAMVYDNQATYCEKKDLEDFCRKLITYLQDRFRECGLPLFETHPLGDELPIYGDILEWEQRILTGLRSGEKELVSTARKMLDMRSIYGDASIVEKLKSSLYAHIRQGKMYRAALFETQTVQKSPVGFFKKFIVNESGQHEETFDIKERAMLPVVDMLRALAIHHDIQESSTSERINILSSRSVIEKELAHDLGSALEFLIHSLMDSQLREREKGISIDNVIDPGRLTMLEKKSLTEIFHIIPVLNDTVIRCLERQEVTAK